MGKKSKRHTSAPRAGGQKATGGDMLNNKAVCRVVDELWEKTQGPANESIASLWQEYHTIRAITQSLKEKQRPLSLRLPDRKEAMPEFERWLKENGTKYESVEITEYPESGFGMRAVKDIEAETNVINVPENLMMTTETAMVGPIGHLISQDRVLQVMQNATLVVHLLNEKYTENSFWKPYIDILPHSFDTPFFFSEQELLMLQSSPTLEKAILQIRNISKLYAHLHRLVRTNADPSLGVYKSGFGYDEFIWAVFCVMSRQNEVPTKGGQRSNLALIPLWDLCNHTEGHMSTFFNIDNHSCDCLAQQKVHAGEEFKIFYGPRNNADLFIHQGFVYPENQSDSLSIKLGLSAGEEEATKKIKKQLLLEFHIPMSGSYQINAISDCPFTSQLITFIRIFTATTAQLHQYLAEDATKRKERLNSLNWDSSDERVFDFLEKRCTLLLLHYKSTIEQDTALLSSDQLSLRNRVAVMMRLSEKKILQRAITFSQTLKQQLAELTKTSEASVQEDVTPSQQEEEEEGVAMNGEMEQIELNKETPLPSKQLHHDQQTQEEVAIETGTEQQSTMEDQCTDKEGTVEVEREM